jgi:hypothetical protein
MEESCGCSIMRATLNQAASCPRNFAHALCGMKMYEMHKNIDEK